MQSERKLSAEQTLLKLIDTVTLILEELQSLEEEEPGNEAISSAKSAYVTCLEIAAFWDKAEENGLDFNIEEAFPV